MQKKAPTFSLHGLLATVLLLVTALVHTAPVLPNTTGTLQASTHTNPLHDRGTAIKLQIEGDIYLPSCVSSSMVHMCTIFYTTNPQKWGQKAVLYAYDYTCSQLGVSWMIPRDVLAYRGAPGGKTMGWKFPGTGLPHPLYVYVTSDWDATNPDPKAETNNGVGIEYNGVVSNPLYYNEFGLVKWGSVPGVGGNGTWAYWRGQFECSYQSVA